MEATRKLPMKLQWFAEPAAAGEGTQQTAQTEGSTQPAAQTSTQATAATTQTQQPAQKTFTQEEVNRIAANEKQEGKKSVYNKFKALGIDEAGVDKLVALLSNETQTEGAAQPAQDDTMIQQLLSSQVRAELSLEGVSKGAVDDMEVLVKNVINPKSYTMDDIHAAIKDVKTRNKDKFISEGTANQQSTTQSGTGTPYGGTPTESSISKRDGSFGRQMAQALKGK